MTRNQDFCIHLYPYPIFQGSIRVDGYDSFGVERDTTPFLEEAEEIRTGPSNG